MITEDYVSFEIAKLLKEKGFDGEDAEDCFAFYKENGEIGFLQTFGDIADYDSETHALAPTLHMAMKWLREKGIIITITYTRCSMQTIGFQMMFGFNIQNVQGDLLAENTEVAYDSYEQSEMDAIKCTLEYLI